MKKAFLIMAATALIALLVTSVVPRVSAHPGRTDSKGGHNNRSTGEYHYHHGYPEHDHYDMDGDGKADCPYEFDDKTDSKEKSNTSNQNESKSKADSSSVFAGIIAVGLYVFLMFILPSLIS